MRLALFRCSVLMATLMCFASVTNAQCPDPLVNQAEYGTDAWNGYLYDGVNNFDPSVFIGRKNQTTTINEDFAFGTTDAPALCPFPTETFSVRFKNRQSFSCGLHTFTVGSNYGVRFSIDGGNTFPINIPSGTVFVLTDYTVHLTGGVYDLVLEYFHDTGTPQVSFAFSVPPGPGDFAGEVSGDQTICNDPVDPAAFTSLSAARFCSQDPASYQWEVSVDGGAYTIITGATSLTFDPPSVLVAGSYVYRRGATDGSVTIYSNEISVVADIPLGNESSFGTGEWLGYAYEGADNYATEDYLGNIQEALLAFTEDFSTTLINGCDLPVESFSVRFKRQENIAPCGGYDITIGAEGGGARLYIDGTLVIDGYTPVTTLTTYSANLFLSAGDHQFILEYYNNTGANSVSFAIAGPGATGGGGVIGSDQSACGASYDPAPFTNIEDANFCSGPFTYQWQESPTGADPWFDISGEQSATYDVTTPLGPGTHYYRREASDGVPVYSNTVLVEVKQPAGDEITYPATAWRGYVYNGADNFSSVNYLGYFDNTSQNMTENFSAVALNGCDMPAENFSVRFRRELTLACGGYDIILTGDDQVRLYLDDVELTNGYTTSYSGNIFLDGVVAHEFDIEYYVVTGTKNVSFTITASGLNYSGGVVGYSQDICDGLRDPDLFASLADGGACSGTPAYQWQRATSPSGPWTDLGVTTSTYKPPALTAGVYYYQREFSDGVQPPVYSNVLEVSAFTPNGDEVSFGDNAWIGYVYDNKQDWATDFRGSITRPTNFDESFCAGLCEFSIDGCPVVATEFSILFKNQVDFECGSYLVTIGGDDGVRLTVDGTIELDGLSEHPYTTYSRIIYFDGTPDIPLELQYFESAASNRVSFSAVFLGPGDAGTIEEDQYYCQAGVTPTELTSPEEPATSCTASPITYQWQFSLDGLGWSDITTGGTAATYTPPPLNITHYYRRQATMEGYDLNSNVVTVEIDPPQGDEVTYGQNQWIGYVYDTFQDTDPWNSGVYQGYMIENTDFDRSFCGPSCTQAINGCDFNTDDFSIRYLNEMTLECGYYHITIGFSGGGRLIIDGDTVLSEYWIHDPYFTLETTVPLTAGTHTFRYEYREDLFGNQVSFDMEFMGAGTPALIGNHQVLCSGADDPEEIIQFVAPVFECSPDLTPSYQWQVSTDNVAWSDIPSATSISYDPPAGHTFTGHYRRKDTNDIGDELISDVVTIAYNTDPRPFDGSEFGTAPEWIGHVYNGPPTPNFSTYQGSFIETMVGDAFDESFCGPNCIFPLDGCDIITNTFTVQFKTEIDLPAGEYTFTIGSTGAARLIISGEEIVAPTEIVNDYVLHYPYRTRSNNTPLANGTPLELQGGTYFLVLDYFEEFSDNQVSFSYIFAPLPVTWHYFNGYYADGNAYVEWRTASEINNSGFEVERSIDGTNFTKIGWVEGNGTTNVEQQYLFTDESPEQGWNYYRLKQIDHDEKFEYSRLIPVYVDDLPQVEIYPNPFHDHLYLSRVNTELRPEVTLTNILGQRSWTLTQDPMQPARFVLPTRLEPGLYSARIRFGDVVYTRKVIIE